jgi:hypothetical protein
MAAVSGGASKPFCVDTGCAGTGQLEKSLFANIAGSGGLQPLGSSETATVAGVYSGRDGRLADFALGPFRHAGVVFHSGDRNMLGLGYLNRYRVTIDFPGQMIYLAKGKQFSGPDGEISAGMAVFWKNGRPVVYSVDENSPAELAGIQARDKVLTVQGKPASKLTANEFWEVIYSADCKPVNMTVDRGGKRISASFTPQEKSKWPKTPSGRKK